MEETKNTEEVVTEETVDEDVGGVEGYDYDDLEYDEDGNVIIPDDEVVETAQSAISEEPDVEALPKDPKDDTIADLRARLAKMERQARATLKDLGYEGEDVIDGLTKVSAEASGKDHETYKRELAEEERRVELERKLVIAEGEQMMAEDMAIIVKEIPGVAKYKSPLDFPNFRRFGQLRDMGASPVEAFRASHPSEVAAGVAEAAKSAVDSKGHMTSAVPKAAKDTSTSIPSSDLEMYKDLFPNASPKQLESLYRRATKT